MKDIYILIAAAAVLTGCTISRSHDIGPSETVETFCQALTAGDFDKAESLCDTLSMMDYIERFRSAWEAADSSVMAIVPAILSDVKVYVSEVAKNGQERTVFYELTAPDGLKAEKAATLRKTEDIWKITSITDRH